MVAQYETQLIPKAVLQRKLREWSQLLEAPESPDESERRAFRLTNNTRIAQQVSCHVIGQVVAGSPDGWTSPGISAVAGPQGLRCVTSFPRTSVGDSLVELLG
jgi:hypothetical protein